jgi:putative tryptophan/tyrosine transport system substrate-binding protein
MHGSMSSPLLEDAIRAVQQATKTIPIVAIGGDLLASGFVNSLSRPDGNTTGVSFFAFESNGKRQDILIEAVPGLRLMAVLTDVNTTSAAELDALQEAARGLLLPRSTIASWRYLTRRHKVARK